MLELYKGQISLDELKHTLPYKEALQLRDTRIKRLKAEQETLERDRKDEERRQQQMAARSKILS